MRLSSPFLYALLLPLAACAQQTPVTSAVGYGYNPALPAPHKQTIPTVDIAPAIGWPRGVMPAAAPGLAVRPYATGLDHPRWLYVLPNGDVLVAETNAPPKPEDGKGIKGKVMGLVMKRAGAGVPSANRITLLRGMQANGLVQSRSVFLKGLNSPFGMALVGGNLYVANSDAVWRFPYTEGATAITAAGVKVADLPGGPINHHWTKNILASRDGRFLYATSGSNSNVGENGMAAEENRAAILEIDLAKGSTRLFASGIRNPNGLAWNPRAACSGPSSTSATRSATTWCPDYMTSVKDGGFYGWPYSYYGQHVDERVTPPRPDLVAKAIVPDFALGSHTASLGLAFNDKGLFPAKYKNGAFIGQHGSWNRKPPVGYKVVFVPFSGGKPTGMPEDILTGFVNNNGKAMGRPVGVAFDNAGALLVADDVGNAIWRVTPAAAPAAAPMASSTAK
jgi:glucose/arabinose dehydrogenase